LRNQNWLRAMPFRTKGEPRLKNRRDAERAIDDIVRDGGVREEYRIDQAEDGLCVIAVIDPRDGSIAGTVGV
jgi:hypothetical protein